MTVDTTVANERTFIARQTWGNPSSAIEGDWIDTQFGADYLVKVYKNDPSVGVAGVDYFDLSAAGTTGKDDVWFFDYSSGVLNFNGEDLDGQLSGITTSNIYIVGYRYIGRKGIQPPAGIGTFHDLVVSNNFRVVGISTFQNKVHLLDNDVLNLGGSTGEVGDLLIFANGTTNAIDARNSPLTIRNNVSNTGGGSTHNIQIQAKTGESSAIFNPEGSVDLYYDNVKRLATSGTGVTTVSYTHLTLPTNREV